MKRFAFVLIVLSLLAQSFAPPQFYHAQPIDRAIDAQPVGVGYSDGPIASIASTD